MSKEKSELYVQLVPNAFTPDNDANYIARPLPAKSFDRDGILAEAIRKNPGLEPETLAMSYDVLMRTMEELLLEGNRLRTELFTAGVSYTGIVEKGVWNAERNKVRINFTQSRNFSRKCSRDVHVNITSQQSLPISLTGVTAASNHGIETHNRIVAGRPAVFTGKSIQLAGTDPSVGVTLRHQQTGIVTKIDADMFSQNTRSRLAFVVPAGLAEGEYEMTVTTQFSGGGGALLKHTRSISQTVYIGGNEPVSHSGV